MKTSPAPVLSTGTTDGAANSVAVPPSNRDGAVGAQRDHYWRPGAAASTRRCRSGRPHLRERLTHPDWGSSGRIASSPSGIGRSRGGLTTSCLSVRAAKSAAASSVSSGISKLTTTTPPSGTPHRLLDLGRRQFDIGARSHCDHVLASSIYGDEGHRSGPWRSGRTVIRSTPAASRSASASDAISSSPTSAINQTSAGPSRRQRLVGPYPHPI